ncbi:MAG: YigZ family protein [Thiotrichales bacterium]|nr:YigZ family protein [Thiotrichales bacterium]
MSYPIPAAQARAEIEIKKSRFIAYACGIESREQGQQWLESLKAQYPDARHHCWAYLLGDPQYAVSAGMGDDGEPSGTAGKPILNVLQHKGVGDIMLVVVRYFGGIKLGAGGLTRAYGQAAQAVMAQLLIEERVAQKRLLISCDFAQEQLLRHWCQQVEGGVEQVHYHQQVEMGLQIPVKHLPAFLAQLESVSCFYQLLE